MKKRGGSWVVVLVVFLMFSLVLVAGCGSKHEKSARDSGEPKETAAEKDGGTIVIALNTDSIVTFDPANYRDRETETVLRNMFDGLVTRTPDGKVVPQIAESWKALSPTEWEFKIRKGIVFHNGETLTAEDVVFTFQRIIKEGAINGQTAARKGLLGPIEQVESTDEYTVVFKLKEPFPVILQALCHQQIIPKDYYEEVGLEGFLEKPVGCGPFKFVEGKLDDRVVMVRFDDYYGGSPEITPVGPPKLKRVIFRMIPELSTAVAALKTGEVNIIQRVPEDMIEDLNQDESIQVKEAKGTRVYAIEINNKMPPFDNPKVRKAFNHAIDMDKIIKELYKGYAVRLPGPMLPYAFAAHPDLKPYEYNPEKAKQLLQEAGVKDLKVVIDTEPFREEEALVIAEMLKDVGIDASVRKWEWSVLKAKIKEGSRQIYLTDWGNAYLDPFDFLNPKLKTGGRGNYSFYSNPEVDELLEKAGKEIDEEKRKELYYRAQEIIYNDAPWVFGYSKISVEAATSNVKNWRPSMDSRENMHDVYLEE